MRTIKKLITPINFYSYAWKPFVCPQHIINCMQLISFAVNINLFWIASSFSIFVSNTNKNSLFILGVPKAGLEYQRISIDRSKLSEDEAFEHAIDMISSRQMGFRKAADFFQVSKWKLYKTARKRGIYAEIKKHNQAHVSIKHLGENVKQNRNFYNSALRLSHETCF